MALGLLSLRVDGQAAGQHGVGGALRDADARDVPPRHGEQQRYEPQGHQLCACRTRNRVRFVLACGRRECATDGGSNWQKGTQLLTGFNLLQGVEQRLLPPLAEQLEHPRKNKISGSIQHAAEEEEEERIN